MYIPLIEIITILAVLNATITNQEVPIEVQVTPVEDIPAETTTTGAASANPAFDTAAITGIIAAIGGLLVAWKKGQSNDNAIADTITNLKESLKATDKGAADTAQLLARVTEQTAAADPKLAEALIACKPAAEQNAKEWKNDVKSYYESFKPSGPEDRNLNQTKSKLAVVNKETKPVDSS